MRKDDIFRMMSSSKCITATAVLMMADAGKLSIHDKVSRFIPSFANPRVVEPPPGWEEALADPKKKAQAVAAAKFRPASREITVKDLLTHTSGLMSSGEGTAPGAGTLVNDYRLDLDRSLAEAIPRLGGSALDFDPGTKWRYSPLVGMDTLLYIVELVSGQPADVFLRERLFEPLDMRDTFFNVPPSKRGRVLTLYERKGTFWRPAHGLVGYEPVRYFSGAGGLLSTVHDYLQFEEMLRNRGELNGHRILKPETVAMMSRNQVGTKFAEWIPAFTAGTGFGLGVRVVEDPKASGTGRGPGAFGWGGAYGTESWVDPSLDLTACYFVQQPVRPALTDFENAVRKAVVA
jgi:CubicO group peptidase (beta-lactamase class C family)